jgi:hypothetical protein
MTVVRRSAELARLLLWVARMKKAEITTQHANRATDRRTKLRLRDLCDEVLASYHQARGHDLFSSDDRKAARELISSAVSR